MAFVAVNGFDVEHASSMLVYENLFPEIQHINGKGVVDKYTKTNDVESVTYIDVMRVLPYAPRFRKLGASANGGFSNALNGTGKNAPQSTHYTIPVDLIYDEGVAISSVQTYSNPIALKQVVIAQLVKVAGMSINVITYAKQLEGFFRNGDNFDKALTHAKGAIVSTDITAAEIADAVYSHSNTVSTATDAFLEANNSLNDGVPEIGAFVVPADERQAFVSAKFNKLMKGQYMQNASEASARILATGFMNPFNDQESKRIDTATGIVGMYDGVDMFLFNKVTRRYVYTALGLDGEDYEDVRASLDKIDGILVYGAGTVRGVVGPTIEAGRDIYNGGVYILPKMKVGVEVLHGATIKLIIDGSTASWTASDIADIMNAVTFTAIDGQIVKGNMAGFNDGTTF